MKKTRFLMAGFLLMATAFVTACTPASEITPAPSPTEPAVVVTPAVTPDVAAPPQMTETPMSSVPLWETRDPVAAFTDSDVSRLGIDCSGTAGEISRCILRFMDHNFIHCSVLPDTAAHPECSDALRTQDILPGLYSSLDSLRLRTPQGKIYGLCFDYAAVVCSLSRYFGVECRIAESIASIAQDPNSSTSSASVTGALSQSQFDRIKEQLDGFHLPYPYDAMHLVFPFVPTGPGHYWAEMLVDGEWVVVDNVNPSAPKTEDVYKATNQWQVTDWNAKNRSAEIAAYTQRILDGEDLRGIADDSNPTVALQNARTFAYECGSSPVPMECRPAQTYEGIVDDLGQRNRSSTMNDFMQGLGLMPYFYQCADMVDFLEIPMPFSLNVRTGCEMSQPAMQCYQQCAGQPFYYAVFTMCKGEYEGEQKCMKIFPQLYELATGTPLNVTCQQQCAP